MAISRNAWKEKAKHSMQRVEKLQRQLEKTRRQLRAVQQEQQDTRQELSNAKQKSPWRPDQHWKALPGHQYSAELIALGCQLAAIAGFRAAEKTLKCFSDSLGLHWKVPSHDAMRNWTCRIGVALLQQERADDWIWMVDHSVQLGKMCVLVILGIRHGQVPEGRPLRRSDMSVIAVLPSQSRNKDKVTQQLQPLVDRLGLPLAILSDGASELKAAVERTAKNAGKAVVHLSDIKHKVACTLKKSLKEERAFVAFFARVNATAATIRQTELDHLQPPRRKDKCRFMNIHREVDWAKMVLSELDKHEGRSDRHAERLREKLGWVAEYREAIKHWSQCREIIALALKWSNAHGVYPGASDALAAQLNELPADGALVDRLRQEIISGYRENEAKLSELRSSGRHLPCSTEVLESAFGSYKAMQRYHNRGTFTTLLAAFPTLFERFSAARVREQFDRVRNANLVAWLRDHNLTNSTQSRRRQAYAASAAT